MVYERVLTNIRDLDEDFSTGKMGENDYEAERETWVQRGIQVLKTFDGMQEQVVLTSEVDHQTLDRSIDDEIEAAIAAYRTRQKRSHDSDHTPLTALRRGYPRKNMGNK